MHLHRKDSILHWELITLRMKKTESPSVATHDILEGELQKLKTVNLAGFQKLNKLLESIEHLKELETLNLTRCATLPESIGELKSLKTLNLSGCHNLKNLPESIGALKSLETLNLTNCQKLEKLPESIVLLKRLKTLNLSGCHNLENLPESIGALKELETIIWTGRDLRLRKLPESISKLERLKTFNLNGCSNLENVPESICALKGLETLILSKGYKLTKLPECIGELSGLKTLEISHCEKLENLPESIGALTRLETLILTGCRQLEMLPESIGELNELKMLSFFMCYNLVMLPESISSLKGLETLNLTNGSNLEMLPDSIGELKGLKYLMVSDCEKLEKLPNSIDALEGLKTLELNFCLELEELPKSIGALKELETLILKHCRKLILLPMSIGELKELKTLDLLDCSSLVAVPESIGSLKSLETLILHSCVELKKLPDSIGELTGLRLLDLSECKRLEKLPKSIGALKAVETLKMAFCEKLTKLPKSLGKLQSLKTLDLNGCKNLEKLPDSISQLEGLDSLVFGDSKYVRSHKLYGCKSLEKFLESIGKLKHMKAMQDVKSPESMDILQEANRQKSQNLLAVLNVMLDKLQLATGVDITRVCKFSDTTANLQPCEGDVRILCKMGTSEDDLEFYFQDENKMSKVVGIGVKNSKAILTSNLDIHVVCGSHIENQWEAILEEASQEGTYEDLVVKFPHVDPDVQLKYLALSSSEFGESSSREFGVRFEGSDETSVAISINPCESSVCMTKFIPLLWEAGKYVLLKRGPQSIARNDVLYAAGDSKNSNQRDSRGKSSNSTCSHPGECSNQSISSIPYNRSQKNQIDDDDSRDDEEEDGDGDGDKDKGPNQPRKANDDENPNDAIVTVIFRDGVGKFTGDDGNPVPSCLEKFALIFPELKFHFIKMPFDRKITIGSRVEFELAEKVQPNTLPSNEFGWLHDQLGISMSCTEKRAASLDVKFGLCEDFEGQPLPDVGKSIEMTNSTYKGARAAESGRQIGGIVKFLPVADVNGKLSLKMTNTHQDSIGNQISSENPTRSNLPGGFTFRSKSHRRTGHLAFEIMYPKPLCQMIPDSRILWSNNADRMSIMRSGRCLPFNATLQGTWIDLDDQEQAIYFFNCKRELSKLHRDSDLQNGGSGAAQLGYSESKFNQQFSFGFSLNHAMTHLCNIPKSRKVETHEGGKKVLVPKVITQHVAV
ncbi:hypothetical protein O6H91_22G062200 [Diphasiastrum complanatum]|uniref:Uncharacterized protein n=1 Tax=Diphasiastrum complanatum TaxID=34168 RepID=A0ACC2AG82_DIPCM|nr:hypothetical protein O6H91_22G062200 [Diphasiastrum complanatum]